jgi:hypothetical protein
VGGCRLEGKAGVGAKCVQFLKVEVVVFGKSLPLLVLINVDAAVTISLCHGVLTFDAFYHVNFALLAGEMMLDLIALVEFGCLVWMEVSVVMGGDGIV